MLVESFHTLSFRQVLPDQSVGVFVGPSFPRVMRSGKVELRAGGLLNGSIAVEFGSIIRSDRFKPAGVSHHQLKRRSVGFLRRARAHFPNEHNACLSFYQRQDAMAAFSQALAHHRVDLPMADSVPVFHGSRPLADVAFSSKSASAVVAAVAFAEAALAVLTQVQMEAATGSKIAPHVLVNGFVADPQFTAFAQVAGDLFRTPFPLKQLFHPTQFCFSKAPVAPGAFSPGTGPLMCPIRAVAPVVSSTVAPHFSPNGAPMALEHNRNFWQGYSARAQRSDGETLFGAELTIDHG